MLELTTCRYATLLFLAACGGRSIGITADDAGGIGPSHGGSAVDASTTDTNDSGSAVDGSTTNTSDSGDVIDPTLDGGLLPPTDPGYVRCGSVTCDPQDHCCLSTQGDPATNGCASRSQPLCNGTQVVRDCARQADCHPDEVCCYEVFTTPPATLGSRCVSQGACGGEEEAIGCGSDADCAGADAGACFAQRCRGDIIQTCGEMASDMCTP